MRFSLSPMVSSRSLISFLCPWMSFSRLLIRSYRSISRSVSCLMCSFCSSISFCKAENLRFMIPFSPLSRSVASRSTVSLATYFSLSSSISRSASSSISCFLSSNCLTSTCFFFSMPSRSLSSSVSLDSNSLVTSFTYRSCVSTMTWFCSSHLSASCSRSSTRLLKRCTSASILSWYEFSMARSWSSCCTSSFSSRSLNIASIADFSFFSLPYFLRSCSSSSVNLLVTSLMRSL
mmetsp:Transcript_1642/g.5127  ORF Transcript_1642/g.5127 Transcript_1642/m.5127 type:complete len:234 (+) Transcript_1642:909-1610(+)